MPYKYIKIILQGLLLAVVATVPFVKINTLYFPFVSGKVYFFRFLVSLAFFFWVWLMLKDRQGGIYKNILVIALAFFLLAQCVVSFFGADPALSLFSTIERQDGVIQYGFWVLYFLMLLSSFKSPKEWKIFFSVFIVAALAVSAYAWVNFGGQRLAGVFGNPSYLAAYLIFAIGFCLILLERKLFENKFVDIFLWFLSLFFAITIFFTQTRGVYLGLAGGILLFCILAVLFLRKQNKKLAVFCAIILAIGLISVTGLFFAKDTNFVKNNSILSRVTEVANFWQVGSIRDRVLTWEIALKAFKEKPIFGYGPENFMVAFNKYYDFRVGKGDPWFDHAHNQFLEYLATGGILLISFYFLLQAVVIYAIFKISKKNKLLSFTLAGIYLAYIIQGLFLFDTLPVYLGLFPLLAYIVYELGSVKTEENVYGAKTGRWQIAVLFGTALISLFSIYTTVFQPYTASASAIQFLAGTNQGYYVEAIPFAKKALEINSPYTYWELRKRVGWQFLSVIDGDTKFTDQQAKDLGDVYDFLVPELEKFAQNKPYDPQIYYVLPRIYRLGSQKLGKNDLEKARLLLEKGFTHSNARIEYYNEKGQLLLLEGKASEAEKFLEDYAQRMQPITFDYFSTWFLGNFYYVEGRDDLAMENYEQAREKGYDFTESFLSYSRYVDVADKTKNYQKIVDMSLNVIKNWNETQVWIQKADVYFNVALGYYYLGDKVKAKEFFEKAVENDKAQYEQYARFFNL